MARESKRKSGTFAPLQLAWEILRLNLLPRQGQQAGTRIRPLLDFRLLSSFYFLNLLSLINFSVLLYDIFALDDVICPNRKPLFISTSSHLRSWTTMLIYFANHIFEYCFEFCHNKHIYDNFNIFLETIRESKFV